MLTSYHHVQDLSRQYGINEEDIILIALNACGLRATLPNPRVRFKLRLYQRPEEQFFFILGVRDDSPFELQANRILFQEEPVAEIESLENDDAVLGYFRNGHHVLTLNSNARSQCVGCAFCYTVLQDQSDPGLRMLEDLKSYLALVKDRMGWETLVSLETLSVCTGCFHFEERAIEHLELVRSLLQDDCSDANIHFLSSVVRSRAGFERIQREVAPFHLTLTVECFSNRELILKKSKASLTYDLMLAVLRMGKEYGCKVDFTYIVGLDSPEVVNSMLPALAAEVTTFPRFQIFQAHNSFMDFFANPTARNIEYFLTIRQNIEQLLRDRPLRPRSWENYRPLWYFTFADEELSGVRV